MLDASIAYVLMSHRSGVRPVQNNKSRKNQTKNQTKNKPVQMKQKSPSAVELFFMRK